MSGAAGMKRAREERPRPGMAVPVRRKSGNDGRGKFVGISFKLRSIIELDYQAYIIINDVTIMSRHCYGRDI